MVWLHNWARHSEDSIWEMIVNSISPIDDCFFFEGFIWQSKWIQDWTRVIPSSYPKKVFDPESGLEWQSKVYSFIVLSSESSPSDPCLTDWKELYSQCWNQRQSHPRVRVQRHLTDLRLKEKHLSEEILWEEKQCCKQQVSQTAIQKPSPVWEATVKLFPDEESRYRCIRTDHKDKHHPKTCLLWHN